MKMRKNKDAGVPILRRLRRRRRRGLRRLVLGGLLRDWVRAFLAFAISKEVVDVSHILLGMRLS